MRAVYLSMTTSSRSADLPPAIRAFLEGLAELIVEDMLRHTGGEHRQAHESKEHNNTQPQC